MIDFMSTRTMGSMIEMTGTNGSITLNGVMYTGNSLIVKADGTVIIDGVVQDGAINGYDICIDVDGDVDGDVERIETTSSYVSCRDASRVETVSGGVYCCDVQTVSGDVDVSGDVLCDIKTTSGDVSVDGSVGGSVTTMSGDIRR